MIYKDYIIKTVALLSQHIRTLILFILVSTLMLTGCQADMLRVDQYIQKSIDIYENNEMSEEISEKHERDPILSLLGKSFEEIEQLLGKPDEQGSGSWLGPHKYFLYQLETGFIQFSSPASREEGVVVSILLVSSLGVLGARVGMSFQEIIDILGIPDSGPGPGMDNLYYADYFVGEINDGMPEILISFVAYSMDSPTEYVLIKWESFNYEETGIFEVKK